MKLSHLVKCLCLLAAPWTASGALVHQWTFNDGTANDAVGTAHGALHGLSWVGNGALFVSGRVGSSNPNYMITAPLGQPLTERTLVAWCSVCTLHEATTNCAGSVLSVTDGNQAASCFDGIVYGERTPSQWMNGSDYWVRSPPDNGGAPETVEAPHEVMMAITYRQNPYEVTIYRNGEVYARHSYVSHRNGRDDFPTLSANSVAVFGPRNAGSGWFNGVINEARIYDTALTAEEVAVLSAEGPVPSPVTTPWDGSFEANSPWTSLSEERAEDWPWNFGPAWFARFGYKGTTLGFARRVSRWWSPDPTDGATQLWLEVPGDENRLWNAWQKPYAESCLLGNIQAGESYRVQVDVGSGPNANTWGNQNRPYVELVDAANGDVLASCQTFIPTVNTAAVVDFTSPVMTADRAGHPVFVRLTLPLWGMENIGCQIQFAADNVRVTAIPGTAPAVADATFVGTVDHGSTTDGANWEGGLAPTGTVGTLRFAARGRPDETVVSFDAPLFATQVVFAAEGARAVRGFTDGDQGRLTLHSVAGETPEVVVPDGYAALQSLTANDGLVKTGAGTLQIGGFRGAAGTVEVREGRLTIGDDLAHRWSFNDGTGRDLVGLADGVASGGATIENGALHVPGAGQFLTAATGRRIADKTLVVWTRLADPAVSTKGSALTLLVEQNSGGAFDGIVYGELKERCWMAGSENWRRTLNPQTFGEVETSTGDVMVGISYSAQFGNVFLQRNSEQYGLYVAQNPQITFPATSSVIIGPRHFGNPDTYNGWITEARIYRHSISVREFEELAEKGPNACTVNSTTPQLPEGLSFKVAAGATLDFNMMDYTVKSFTGAGTVQNGVLRVTDTLTVEGPLTVAEEIVIAPDAHVAFASGSASLTVAGALALPAHATLTVDPGANPPKRMTLFTSAEPTDWSVLDGWDVEEPSLPCYRFTEFRTERAYGYDIEFVGGTTILIR